MQVIKKMYISSVALEDPLKHVKFFTSILRWVNRKDPSGKNIFEGGFLGLDNIGK